MTTIKEEVRHLLDKLPDDCTLEDIQYHLYVTRKIQKGMERAEKEGLITQEEAEKRLERWTSQ